MNKIINSLLAILVLTFVAGACTKENDRLPSVAGSEGNHVTFTLNTGALRAQGNESVTRPTPALEREKKITDLYAVVFKQGSGVFYKTIKCTPDAAGAANTYTFDAQKAGQYFFFLIANPNDALVQKLQAGPSTKEALGQIIAEQTPGDDASAASFLMTSGLTKVTANAAQTVEIPTPIRLERVSARFDFYNRIEDFVITKITFKKRYTTTHLFPQVKKMSELTFTEDKEYTPTDGAAGLIETIYSYENDTRGETYFILEGTYKGKEIKPQEIRLESFVIKRNHLYNIYLHTPGGEVNPSDPTQTFGKIPFKIQVFDWAEGQELTLEADDALKPLHVDFSAHLSHASYMDPYLKDSPEVIYSATKKATEITLTLGTYMQSGSIELQDPAPMGVELKEVTGSEKTDPVTGKLTKEYKLTLPERPSYDNFSLDLSSGSAKKVLHPFQEVKLTAYNALKNESRPFVIKHGRPKMALEYLAEYNLAPVSGYTVARKLTEEEIQNLAFATSHDNDKSGYFSPYYAVEQIKEVTINGKGYHMASSNWEWANIIPRRIKKGNAEKYFIGKTATDAKGVEEYIAFIPTYKVLKPINKTFYLEAKADYKTSADKKTTYAIRFKDSQLGNLEQVAVKYEWIGEPQEGANNSALKITFRYLGENWNGEVESIATEDFWTKDASNDVTRTLPLVGFTQNAQKDIRERGIAGRYISAEVDKEEDGTPFLVCYLSMADINFNTGATSALRSGGFFINKTDGSISGLSLFNAIRLFENE